MTDAPRVALLGTGTMGAGMARSMLRAGLPVTVWNRSVDKAAPLGDAGATVAETAADAVDGADVVVTMLFDVDAVADVIASVADRMGNAVWVQASTVGIAGIERLEALAVEHGLSLVDAPVVGTKQPAEQGKLVVLAAGADDLRATVSPVFDAIGGRTVWVSSRVGDASALKLAANSWIATITAGTAQALALTQGLGLDPELLLQTIAGGAADSPYLQAKGAAMVHRDFAPQFALNGLLKDVNLMREAAAGASVDTTLLNALAAQYGTASDQGHGDEDIAAVINAFTD